MMRYWSSKELSEKWGIGQCRILQLAREGRIPGAKLVGKTWVFPEDSVKPADGRTRGAHHVPPTEAELFRYPIFEYKDVSTFDPPLCQAELTIKAVTEAVYACHFSVANRLLGDLPETATNRYHRITALYCGCIIDILLVKPNRFFKRYGLLQTALAEDFPHKAEMMEYIHLINATLGANAYYAQVFRADPIIRYHDSFLPRLCNLSAFRLTLETQIKQTELMGYETVCRFLEQSDHYFDLQAVHVYLGCAYAVLDQKAERNVHFKAAIQLAQTYDMFYTIVIHYHYMSWAFHEALREFPRPLRVKITRLSKQLHERYTAFAASSQYNSIYCPIKGQDYVFIVYAVQGLTNKEIAKRLHISRSSISKRYADLYTLLGVKNKKELIELYHRAMGHTMNDVTVKSKNEKTQEMQGVEKIDDIVLG